MKQCSRKMQLAFIGMLSIMSSSSFGMDVPLVDDEQVNKKFSTFEAKSKKFQQDYFPLPTKNNRISVIAGNDPNKKARIVWQAENTRPLIPTFFVEHGMHFLQYKKDYGSTIEKNLYKNMSLKDFVFRLYSNRPVVFYGPDDQWAMAPGVGGPGNGRFEAIGTDIDGQGGFKLEKFISYDEMMLSALLGSSTPTYFINRGDRKNEGRKDEDGTYEEEGIFIGLVGPRFEKPGYMEWKHVIITREQNTQKNGYGLKACKEGLLGVWSQFYNEKFPTFEEAGNDKTGNCVFIEDRGFYFNKSIYQKRIQIVAETFLTDASIRASEQGKEAYAHIVGFGLGEWKINTPQAISIQLDLFIDAFADVIENFEDIDFSNISDIDFSLFHEVSESSKEKIAAICKKKNIVVHFSERNPADKLTGNNEGKLVVTGYAFDSNCFPGNEYWLKKLALSGDPAAASCSTIPELQNIKINDWFVQNIHTTADQMIQAASLGSDEINSGVIKTKFPNTKTVSNSDKATSSGNNNTKLLMIGGIGVTLAAVLYYFFHDRISAHWLTMPNLSFRK